MTTTKPKCPFTKAELSKWREVLVAKSSDLSEDIRDMVRDAMDGEDGHTQPTHQADRGSDADFQELNLAMLDDEETLLWQVKRAIRKIDLGEPLPFGICEHTQKPIPKSRLKLLPWTPLSIEGAEFMEQSNLKLQDMIIPD
jgi:RNA polymerase-binding transcription factor DksA